MTKKDRFGLILVYIKLASKDLMRVFKHMYMITVELRIMLRIPVWKRKKRKPIIYYPRLKNECEGPGFYDSPCTEWEADTEL